MTGGEVIGPLAAVILGRQRKRSETVLDDVLIAAAEIAALVGGYKLVKSLTDSEATAVIGALSAAKAAGGIVSEIFDRMEKKTEVGGAPSAAHNNDQPTIAATVRRIIGVGRDGNVIYQEV
jgi:hypothetical protein